MMDQRIAMIKSITIFNERKKICDGTKRNDSYVGRNIKNDKNHDGTKLKLMGRIIRVEEPRYSIMAGIIGSAMTNKDKLKISSDRKGHDI